MNASLLVGAGLAALVLPHGLGVAVGLAAALGRAPPLQIAGLALLGAVPIVARAPTAAGPTAAGPTGAELPGSRPAALSLTGRWRQPPGARSHVDTAAGRVSVELAADLDPPPLGSTVAIEARLGSGRVPVAVTLAVIAPARGAWLDRWARAAERRLERLVHPAQRGLVAAVVLGRRRQLPLSVQRDAVATGTMHLFALSGMHVALMALALRRLPLCAGRLARVADGLLLAAFVALAGARPPLVRAFLGWCLLGAARVSGRSSPPLHRLGVVALALLAWDPALVDDRSALLSFIAVAGFLGAAPLGRGRTAWLAAPTGAFLATAPLCAEWFGRVTPVGVLVTPLLVPAILVLLVAGLVGVVPGAAFAFLDPLVSRALAGAAIVLERALGHAAALAPEPFRPGPLPIPAVLASLTIVAALTVLSRGRVARYEVAVA